MRRPPHVTGVTQFVAVSGEDGRAALDGGSGPRLFAGVELSASAADPTPETGSAGAIVGIPPSANAEEVASGTRAGSAVSWPTG